MTRQEVERGFAEAGWRIDHGFAQHLLVGSADGFSILAHDWAWEIGDPVFELGDAETNLAYWVRTIPTPEQAAVLLVEHGGPPEEEPGRA